MDTNLPADLLADVVDWGELHPWERRELGRALRRRGLTYREIRNMIPVPKSTLSNWVRDIRLTEDQVAAIRHRAGPDARRGIPVDTQWRRRREIMAIRKSARGYAQAHLDDAGFIAGVVMYWAEGSKTRNFVDLANADPAALRLFVSWARAHLDPAIEFQLGLHLHEGNSEAAARDYWRAELGMPEVAFGKTHIKARGTGHRKNQLLHGVCRVRTRRAADNWHRVMEWIDVVAEHLGALPEGTC